MRDLNQFGECHQSKVAVPVRRQQARVRPMTSAHRGSGLHEVTERAKDTAVPMEPRIEVEPRPDPNGAVAP